MKLAVIIPTLGRDACVRQTLADLAVQTGVQYEVWLVDQNTPSLEGLQKVVGNLRFFHEKTKPLGSHGGRNHAIFKTDADLCVFVDDDVRVGPDFLLRHLAEYQKDPNRTCVAGKVVQPKDGLTAEDMKHLGKRARYHSLVGLVQGNFIGDQAGLVQHLHECNFSAKTSALREIGGFNTEFKGNAYFEGVDLALKLLSRGHSIFYQPSIVVTHLQEPAGGNREVNKAKHTYWFMRNYGLLNSLHMKRVGTPVFMAYGLSYVLGKSLKNRDLKIGKEGLKGLFDGLQYFLK